MNCREFLIEFEDRGTLTEPAVFHLTICTDCKKTSERQTQIWQMIDKFARVNAPNDFDFRVKARIANAGAADFQPRFLPVLRYVLPVAVIVALIGVIAFNTSYFSRGNTNDVAAKEAKSETVENTTPLLNSVPSTAFAPSEVAQKPNEETSSESVKPPLNSRVPRNEVAEVSPKQGQKNNKNNDVFVGWRDSAIRSNRPFGPNGIKLNSNSQVEMSKSPDDVMLSFNGIKTAVENGKQTVKSLDLNSTAARSGIKVGDVIEKVIGDSIFVSRGAERIEIKLQRTINQP